MPAQPEPRAGLPARAARIADLIGWHAVELVLVGTPTVVAAVASPWWLIVSGAGGLAWAGNERRIKRRTTRAALPNSTTKKIDPAPGETDHEEEASDDRRTARR